MRNAMVAAAVIAASWAGAFGVALGVTEWRGDEPAQAAIQPTLCDVLMERLVIHIVEDSSSQQEFDAGKDWLTEELEQCRDGEQ